MFTRSRARQAEEIEQFFHEDDFEPDDSASESEIDDQEIECQENSSSEESAEYDTDVEEESEEGSGDESGGDLEPEEESNSRRKRQRVTEVSSENTRRRGRPAILRGKDGYTWSRAVPESPGRRSQILREPSLKGVACEKSTPIEAWSLLFSEEILEIILQHTNAKIDLVLENLMFDDDCELQSYHKSLSMIELKCFIGLLYWAGLYKLNMTKTQDLFSKFCSPLFHLPFSHQRFVFITRCLRFDDSNSRPLRKESDKFTHVREIWEIFIKNCTKYYEPSTNYTIDEQLLSFRGRCSFKMYLPAKPDKYGSKIVAINDAQTHYMYNAIPYVGSVNKESDETVPSYYVRKLAEDFYDSGRNITADNW